MFFTSTSFFAQTMDLFLGTCMLGAAFDLADTLDRINGIDHENSLDDF